MPPIRSAVATPVTQPDRTGSRCVALMSTPAICPFGPTSAAAAREARVSATTQEAPPCHSPNGWVFPSTG